MRKILLLSILFGSFLFAQTLSYQEIQSIAKESANQFLKEYKNKEKMTLVVSKFINETSIDKDIFIRTLIREIRKSGQYDVINRAENDAMITDARAMRENEEYNPYTTIEKGSLIAPDISLSGKISKSINDGEEIYLFLLTLTDIKTGIVIWDRDVILSKNLATSNTKITSSTPAQSQVSKDEKPKIQEKEIIEKMKHSYFLFGFDGEVGADNESNMVYSGNLKLGYTYKWNQNFSISIFGMYKFWNEYYSQTSTSNSKTRGKYTPNFNNSNDNNDNDELENELVHGLGGGAEIKLGYFYISGGAIVELKNSNVSYLGEGGLSISLGSASNLNLGARYTYLPSSSVTQHRFGVVLGFSFYL